MMTHKRTFVFVTAALALLLLPFFAMQLNVEGVDWHGADYVIAGVLLMLASLGLAAATNSGIPLKHRVIGLGLVGLMFVTWVHLAVGIVDSWPLAGS